MCVIGCRAERGAEKERERMRASERKSTQDSERRQGRVCVCGGGGDGSRCGSAQGGRDIEDDSVTI